MSSINSFTPSMDSRKVRPKWIAVICAGSSSSPYPRTQSSGDTRSHPSEASSGSRTGRDPHPASGEHRTSARTLFDLEVWMDADAGAGNDLCVGPYPPSASESCSLNLSDRSRSFRMIAVSPPELSGRQVAEAHFQGQLSKRGLAWSRPTTFIGLGQLLSLLRAVKSRWQSTPACRID